jgi:Tripartite tricarboxylate transporter family receptor
MEYEGIALTKRPKAPRESMPRSARRRDDTIVTCSVPAYSGPRWSSRRFWPHQPWRPTGPSRAAWSASPMATPLPCNGRGHLSQRVPQRSAAAPDVPTMAEAGCRALRSPPGRRSLRLEDSQEVIKRLSREVNLILRDAELRAHFDRNAFPVDGSTSEALAVTIQDDFRIWVQFVRENELTRE